MSEPDSRLAAWRLCASLVFAGALLLLAGAIGRPAAADGALAEKLDRIFGHADFQGARVGVSVVGLPDGASLYERSAGEPLSLASNTKLVTTAAALDRLGPGFRFETTLFRRGTIRGDALEGDLVVRGGGDPCLGARFDGAADAALRRFGRALREAGVRRVSGDLVADDRLFDREHQHPDWPRDQLDRWYAAPVSALALNDGCVDISVAPGAAAGAPAVVTVAPRAAAIEVENRCVTAASRKEHVVDIGRKPGGNVFIVRGAILAGSEPVASSIAVVEPALLFAQVLRERLADEGVAIGGETRLAAADEPSAGLAPVATHASLLAQALPVVNKRSQNHYAEQLVKALGAAKGGQGSWRGGTAAVGAFLEQQVGLERGSFALVDGSGLARGNKLPARGMTRLLAYMARHEHGASFLASLAVAGIDGTLEKRLRAPALRGRVLAKTGTINAVSSLSGYVLPAGQPAPAVAFSILANGGRGGASRAREAQDAAVEAIAAMLDGGR